MRDVFSAAPNAFLCEMTVSLKVSSAIEQIAQICRLRSQLSKLVTPLDTAGGDTDGTVVGTKRTRDEAAFADAAALLSPAGVGRKTILTCEKLEQTLANLSSSASSHSNSNENLLPSASSASEGKLGIFFAGKWLNADRQLSEYVGRNEKSKVKITLGTVGAESGGDDTASQAEGTTASATGSSRMAETALAKQPKEAAHIDEAQDDAAASLSLSAFFSARVGGRKSHPVGQHDAADDGPALVDDFPVLSSRQLDALSASGELRAAVRDPRLEEILRHIDSAPTREGALRRLEGALKADPDFEAFALQALRVIGHEPSGDLQQ